MRITVWEGAGRGNGEEVQVRYTNLDLDMESWKVVTKITTDNIALSAEQVEADGAEQRSSMKHSRNREIILASPEWTSWLIFLYRGIFSILGNFSANEDLTSEAELYFQFTGIH